MLPESERWLWAGAPPYKRNHGLDPSASVDQALADAQSTPSIWPMYPGAYETLGICVLRGAPAHNEQRGRPRARHARGHGQLQSGLRLSEKNASPTTTCSRSTFRSCAGRRRVGEIAARRGRCWTRRAPLGLTRGRRLAGRDGISCDARRLASSPSQRRESGRRRAMTTMKTWLVGLFVMAMGAASTACVGQEGGDVAEPSAAMQRIATPSETGTSALRPFVMVHDGERSAAGGYDAAAGTLRFPGRIRARLTCERCGCALTTVAPPWRTAPEEEADTNAAAFHPASDDLTFQVDRPLVPGESGDRLDRRRPRREGDGNRHAPPRGRRPLSAARRPSSPRRDASHPALSR